MPVALGEKKKTVLAKKETTIPLSSSLQPNHCSDCAIPSLMYYKDREKGTSSYDTPQFYI
jgi:hypothetical protein